MITLEKNGLTKKVSTGFSWKLLMFGVFYPFFRGDFKGFLVQLIMCFITIGFSWLVSPFFYNKNYVKRMIDKGWSIKTD